VLRVEHEKAMQMGERILQLADRLGDAEMQSEGKLLMGYKLGFRDGPEIALEYLEKAMALYDPRRPRARRLGLGTNPGVISLTVSSLFLWMRGYPDRAYRRSTESILLAQKINHPYSITYALFHDGLLNVWLRNFEIACERAQAVLELSEKHGFRIWSAVGSCLLGTALAGMGRADEGIPLIEHGLIAYRGLKTPPVFWPLLLHLCAGAYLMASRPMDGLPLLDEAMQVASTSEDKIFISEVLILKGDLTLALSAVNLTEAESWYKPAIENAQAVSAPMLELRAAIRLSRIGKELGKLEESRKLLSEAYSKLTEGLTTADLKEASTLLAALSE
jgi:adenylate cyclase